MQEHTREHHTNKAYYAKKIDQPVSAREFFQNAFGERPEWAVHLRGFRIREGLTQLELATRLGTGKK